MKMTCMRTEFEYFGWTISVKYMSCIVSLAYITYIYVFAYFDAYIANSLIIINVHS